jgi:hypothetical protein
MTTMGIVLGGWALGMVAIVLAGTIAIKLLGLWPRD